MQGPCGGCWAARRLLVAPTPAVAAGDQSMDAQQAHLERVLSATTAVLFLASVSYLALSTLYAYLRATRHGTGQQEPSEADVPGPAPPSEATKRALEGIPVRVVVIPRDAPAGGRKKEDAGADNDCAVCLAEYAAGDEVRVLPACRHGFHRDCVDRWLLTRAPTCPVCRAPVAAHLEGADAKEELCPTGHGGQLGDFAAWSLGPPAGYDVP